MFDALTTEAHKSLEKAFGPVLEEVQWQYPREAGRGDIATSAALSLAKKLGKQPREIAQVLAASLASVPDVERTEVAGAGYVNVWLKPQALLAALGASRKAQATKAKGHAKGKRPVIIDYSAPNIAKPLGIHHILSTVIGQSLANLYRSEGIPTVGINHLGDWGTQFGKLAVAMEKWGAGKTVASLGMDGLLALYVRFHEEAEKDPSLEQEALASFRKLEEGDDAMRTFWNEVVQATMASVQRIYDRLHVSFDAVQGESFYEDKMAPVIAEGKEKNVFVPGEEGALIVAFPEEEQLPPYMVVKSDGATLYATRDLATIRYRVDTWHPQAILYVVDVAQQLHFRQLFATASRLGWDVPHLEHVVFGRMRFADASMSTRKGNILKLEDVLDEAVRRAREVIAAHGETIQTDDEASLAEMMGVGALVYGILSQNRKMDIVFDWDKMLSFEGNSAPYLQYTHARARSVLRKAAVKKTPFPKDVSALQPSERLLLKDLLLFPAAVEEARNTHMPHKLANHLYQLCQDFNAFYNIEPILKAEGDTRAFRLALTAETADVLRAGAELLTMRVPDRM
ncbi:MAG: arginine--tRNA ligase [Candidatus Peribacteraceae bacterium]|nr:arginine--tRNA ligase [Candidatus Peribacteraceae bacterium]